MKVLDNLISTNTNYGYDGWGALAAVLGGFLIIFLLIVIAIVVLMVVAEVKMYKKAGKQGWEAIVPFYSQWVLVEIAGLNWWWFLILLASGLTISYTSGDGSSFKGIISLAGLFGSFVVNYNLAKKLHKDTGFAVLMTIFPIVVIPMIAFGKSYQFDHSVEVSKNGPFGGETSKEEKKESHKEEEPKDEDAAFCPNCGKKVGKGSKFCGNCGKEL